MATTGVILAQGERMQCWCGVWSWYEAQSRSQIAPVLSTTDPATDQAASAAESVAGASPSVCRVCALSVEELGSILAALPLSGVACFRAACTGHLDASIRPRAMCQGDVVLYPQHFRQSFQNYRIVVFEKLSKTWNKPIQTCSTA